MDHSILLTLERLHQAGEQAVVASIVRVEGPSYRPPGASVVLTASGTVCGAISGGCLEADLYMRVETVLQSGLPRLVHYDSRGADDLYLGTGTGCGGSIQVLIAPIAPAVVEQLLSLLRRGESAVLVTDLSTGAHLGERWITPAAAHWCQPYWYGDDGTLLHQRIAPPPALLLCGAGDDAMPVARLASATGFRTVVTDPRPAYLTAARFPTASARLICASADLATRLATDGGAIGPELYGVVMSHHFTRDLSYLTTLCDAGATYIGLLGSRHRTGHLTRHLLAERPELDTAMKRVIHAPVGSHIGADGPEQIAVSIAAELIAHRNGCRSWMALGR